MLVHGVGLFSLMDRLDVSKGGASQAGLWKQRENSYSKPAGTGKEPSPARNRTLGGGRREEVGGRTR